MAEWKKATIGEVLTLQRGFDITRSEQRAGSIPVVSSGGIGSYHDTAAVHGPGVVIGRKGTLGKTFYLTGDYWPHDTTLWVKDFKGNYPRFVYYFFLNLDVMGLDVGSANPTLNRNHVHPLPVRWPGLAEQRGIADLLSTLDDKIAVNDRIMETSRKLAVCIGQRLFSWGSGKEVFLNDCADIVKGLSYRSSDLENGTYGLVSLKCVGRDGDFQPRGIKLYGGEYKQSQVVGDGDIVVAQTDLTQRVEVIGRPVRVVNLSGFSKLIASLDLAIVRPRGLLSREVLLSLLSTKEFREHALSYCNGTTVVHLGSKALPEFKFTMPELDAVRSATAEMTPLLARSDQARRETQTLAELRDTLLPKLMSGQIRVRAAEKVVEDVT